MGQQKTGFETGRFHEGERRSTKLSHSDFAEEQQFDYLTETEDLNEYLLSKTWDKFFKKPGPYAQRRCSTSVANQIFESVYETFKFRMDTVQIFHIITKFYDIDATWYFERLVQGHRKHLQTDLEHRVGALKKPMTRKIGEDKIRMTFASLFINKS